MPPQVAQAVPAAKMVQDKSMPISSQSQSKPTMPPQVAQALPAAKMVQDKSMPKSSQPQSKPTMTKSILKKTSAAKETPFTSAIKLLKSSNGDMHQFYDKIKLNSIVLASKRILDYLPNVDNSTNAVYPEYIKSDILLLTSQVRRMFEFKSISTSDMTNAQLETLMNDYMIEMSSSSSGISAGQSSTVIEAPSESVGNGGLGNTGTASSKTSTNIDRTELLNDIDDKKRKNQSTAIAVVQPTPRRRASTIEADDNEKNCLPEAIIEIESSTSGTETESDDDIQYIGRFSKDDDDL